MQTEWQIWRSKLPVLEDIEVRRCIKPVGFEKIVESSIHHFSDASEDGYGQASYLRLVNDQAEVHCILLMGKARVSPLKYVSIPRLELVAATLSVKVGLLLRQELEMKIDKEYFWTNSKVILGYINNIRKRFKIFVANRIQFIRDHSDVSQWRYVPTSDNPADESSRGLDGIKSSKSKRWFEGPSYLLQSEDKWPQQFPAEIVESDPEVKTVVSVNTASIAHDISSHLEERISHWEEMRKVVAWILLLKKKLLWKTKKRRGEPVDKECNDVT